MVMPLYDDNPFRLSVRPVVTWGLIVANIVAYVLEVGTGTGDAQDVANVFGLLPSALTGDDEIPGALPPILTFVTYMFVHGDLGHLFGNMIFLWVFGDDIEEALGRARFLAFYLLCGIAGAAVFVWSDPHAQVTLIGASGAISGIVIAYVMLRPCAKVTFLVSVIPLRVRAYWVVGAFILLQLISLGASSKSEVAYWCHLGGMMAGVILFLVMRPPGVALFQCMQSAPVGAAKGNGSTPGPWSTPPESR
jgi:membrane associated rhomboid family serine protease